MIDQLRGDARILEVLLDLRRVFHVVRLLRSTKKPVMLVANKVDDARQEGEAWTETIASWAASEVAQKLLAKNGRLLVAEIAKGALDIEVAEIDRRVESRIGVAMGIGGLRWENHRVTNDAGRRVSSFAPKTK